MNINHNLFICILLLFREEKVQSGDGVHAEPSMSAWNNEIMKLYILVWSSLSKQWRNSTNWVNDFCLC